MVHPRTENTCLGCQIFEFLLWFNCKICRQVSYRFCRRKLQLWFWLLEEGPVSVVSLGILSLVWIVSINWAKKQALSKWPSCWILHRNDMSHGNTSIPSTGDLPARGVYRRSSCCPLILFPLLLARTAKSFTVPFCLRELQTPLSPLSLRFSNLPGASYWPRLPQPVVGWQVLGLSRSCSVCDDFLKAEQL